MEIQQLKRVFVYNGINLADPGAALDPAAVKEFYGATYPELVNAEIEGPVRKDNADTYTFRKAVGTKGAETTDQKLFHLGDILSITTGMLVSTRHMEGVYDILNFMTNDNLFTHQLPRASRECAPALLAQHPQLASISGEGVNGENFKSWIEQQCAEFGEHLLVSRLPPDCHEVIDPISELAETVHPDKIITVRA